MTRSKRRPTWASNPVVAGGRFPVWLLAVLLMLVTVGVFWPATDNGFVSYDDNQYVVDNPHVTGGLTWANARWAFRSGYASNWHPVTWLSHMLDCQLFGLKPWGHHLTSVLLHALNVMLVFLLLRQMTGAVWRSLFVAALFAVHPLRVESVAWVAERKDVLSAFFGLLALLFYARYAEGRRPESKAQSPESGDTPHASRLTLHAPRLYALSFACFALGLMSKPMLVTWPFVMLLLDYWPLRRFELSSLNSRLSTVVRLVGEKLPFFALAAAASVTTFLAQERGGSMVAAVNLPLGARGENALVSYCRYVGKMLWPTDLAVFYPHHGQWPLEEVVLAGGLLLGISALLLVKRRQYPFLLIGWLWFVGTLVPVIGLVQVGDQAMADRYSYLPSLGLLILAVWGAYALTHRWRFAAMACSVAGSAAIVLCLGLTRQQLGYWKDSESLFRHAVEVTRNNSLAHNNLGIVLVKKGQTDEAITQFEEALRLKPDYPDAYFNLGSALDQEGQTEAAIAQFHQALRWKPNYADAHNKLGYALVRQGHIDEAIRHYREALRLKPDYPDAHCNLGVALARKGQFDEAISQYHAAIRLKPDDAGAYYNLGNALADRGRIDEAIGQYQEALRLNPDYAEAYNNAGIAFAANSNSLPR